MASLTSYAYLTLPEVVKRAGYDREAAVLGELSEQNEFLRSVSWMPSTHPGYNKQLQYKNLGAGAWGKVNAPISTSSSTTDFLVEPVKLYEGMSQVDDRLFDGLSGEAAYRVRDSEDRGILAGMLQGFNNDLLYGDNVTAPDALRSLSARRAKLTTYCVGAGGTGSDLTSLWTFEFGPDGFYLVYNPGSQPGIKNEDRGMHPITAPTGTGTYFAWLRYYAINAGIVLRNERAMIRYANIETSGTSNIFSATDYIKKVRAQLPSFGRNAVAFGNRTLVGQIEAAAYDKSNAAYSLRDIEGFGPVGMVGMVPVRPLEAIVDTETALTA